MASQAKIKYSIGLTINIPEYQSARVDIGVELPCDPDKLDETYDKAKEYCENKLTEEMETLMALKGALKPKKG